MAGCDHAPRIRSTIDGTRTSCMMNRYDTTLLKIGLSIIICLIVGVVVITLLLVDDEKVRVPSSTGSDVKHRQYHNNDDIISLPKQQDIIYDVIIIDLDAVHNNGSSLISFVNGTSEFQYNFNSPWFPSPISSSGRGGQQQHDQQGGGGEGLLVRVVDYNRHPEWSDAGAIAVVPVSLLAEHNGPLTSAHVSEDRITWLGTAGNTNDNNDINHNSSTTIWGAVDPRVTYRPYNQMYYVTWDNCTQHCWPQRITYLSTTTNPYNSSSWTFHGSVFPFPYTSGAAILFRDDEYNEYDVHVHPDQFYNETIANMDDTNTTEEAHHDQRTSKLRNPRPHTAPHLAFVCNSNTADTIYIVESYDGIHWTIPNDPSRQILMKGRKGYWDEHGVAVGPQPEKLINGDYLLIYNIDTGWPYKPNPLGRCAIGWALLDKDDPTTIVARSNKPLLVATQPWETCQEGISNNNQTTKRTTTKDCNVPMVVFATGLKPLGNDTFFVIYGGADSVVMVSKIKVNTKARNVKTESMIY